MVQNEQENIRRLNLEQAEKIKAQLQSIQRTMLSLKKTGIHQDILIAYLHDRTGMSKRDLVSILNAQEEFYKKLVKLTGD